MIGTAVNEQLLLQLGIKVMTEGKERITPIVLKPNTYGKKHYDEAVTLQPVFNQLVAELNYNKDYLLSICRPAAKSDPEFTGRLFNIAETANDQSGFILNVLRSDYMVDSGSDRLLQVELNTTCCALGSQSDKLSEYFRSNGHSIPTNGFINATADTFVEAHQEWCQLHNQSDAVIAFVVMENERNVHDHALLRAAIEKRGLRVKRVYLTDIFEQMADGSIKHEGDTVSIFYFRTGYMPAHYRGDSAWANRLAMEKSLAIKVPNMLSTLAGLKVVQQTLFDGQFISQCHLGQLMSCFTDQYSLGAQYEECMSALKHEPNAFVLKPQREGGGNNIYAADVLPFIRKLAKEDRSAYILMRLIRPRIIENVNVLRFGERQVIKEAVQELGIFGVYLGTSQRAIVNKSAGWMVRTKSADSQEGAVSLGLGFLDCPVLK